MVDDRFELKTETFSRAELAALGNEFLFPGAGEMSLMPKECWSLIVANPHQRDDLPSAVLGKVNGERAAAAAFVHRKLRLPDRELTSAWDFSFYATPKGRSAGVAGLMMRRAKRTFAQAGVPVASHGATPEANRIYQALGMTDIGLAPRFVLLLDVRPVLHRYLGSALTTRVLSSLANPLLRGWARVIMAVLRLRSGTATIRSISDIGVSDLPDFGSYAGRAMLVREPAVLNAWVKYARSIPGALVRCVSISHNGQDSPCAYAVVRTAIHDRFGSQGFRNVKVLRALDLLAETGAPAAAAALQGLIRLAIEDDCDLVELVTTDPVVTRLCCWGGFLRANGYQTFVDTRTIGPDCPASGDWLLTMFESEASCY